MLCDICKKNEATIHIQQIANGEKKTMNLCVECAAKNPDMAGLKLGLFNLGEMFFNSEKPSQKSAPAQLKLKCPRCGWTMEKLRNSGGKLGCPECYKTFAELIEPALNSIHRGAVHTGKTPGVERDDVTLKTIERQIAALKQELPQAVKLEQYERAAQLRDQISELKRQLKASSHKK